MNFVPGLFLGLHARVDDYDAEISSETVLPDRLWQEGQPVRVSGEHVSVDSLELSCLVGLSDEEGEDARVMVAPLRGRLDSLFDAPEWDSDFLC
jgi:hypothetical protein